MRENKYSFSYKIFESIDELDKADAALLRDAWELTQLSYAPYSRFHVASVARLSNGKLVKGTNQENASFPVGICAERSLLATAGTLYPDEIIETIAITYQPQNGKSNKPISPCGMCRQAILEYENRVNHRIRLVLGGKEGEIFVVETAKDLLPLAFRGDDLG